MVSMASISVLALVQLQSTWASEGIQVQTSEHMGIQWQDINVYDKPMIACGSSHATGCTYEASDAGAHEVCVTQLPKGFSSETGQGAWSEDFAGQPWCICIWAYSNYILQHKDLPLRCESIPSKVLEDRYSLDKFKQCGSMQSTEGCGPEDIRRSIESLCQQCDQQAGTDQAAKAALTAKCNAILASAPAAQIGIDRLYSSDTPKTRPLALLQSMGGSASFAFGFLGLTVASASVGMVVRVFSRSGNQQNEDQRTGDDFLEDESLE